MSFPRGSGDHDTTKQYLRFAHAALMDGWLSDVPFFIPIALVAALVFTALYHWWAALIVFVLAVFIGTLTKGRSGSYYLMFMHAQLLSRAPPTSIRMTTSERGSSEHGQ